MCGLQFQSTLFWSFVVWKPLRIRQNSFKQSCSIHVALQFLLVFSDHRRVNLYLRIWLGWCARRTQWFILARAERPYVQFVAARITDTWFAVGVTNRWESEMIPSLWWKEWTGAESSLAAQPCARVVLLCSVLPFHGAPASPFIGEGKARVTE